MIKRYENFSLLHNNTFGIDQRCDELVEYASVADAVELSQTLRQDAAEGTPLLILGGGSNLLLTQDFHGRVVTAEKRFDVEILGCEAETGIARLRCWAGTDFDQVVAYAVEHGYYGLENLSLIPGECGASAVQNIGAYGVEAKDLIEEIEAVEIATGEIKTIKSGECGYAYRQSKFKHEWRDRFLITHVTYRLSTTFRPHLDYGNIRSEMEKRGITEAELTGSMLRQIVIDIRRAKLPDPADLGNAGSFFMNPIVGRSELDRLKAAFPDLRYFEVSATEAAPAESNKTHGDGEMKYKIPAGWMIDRCGWKGRQVGRVGVYDKQALVLVNHGGATGHEVVELMEAIQADVLKTFGLHIYPEVNIR